MTFVSCQRQQRHDNSDTIMVNLNPQDKELSASNLMDIVEWVELKADSSSYIGYVKKLEMFSSNYYILEKQTQKCVLRYDNDGNLVNKIGRIGEGPGEYPDIYDFTIDSANSKVLVLTSDSNLYIYNLDGTFVKKTALSGGTICMIAANPCGLIGTTSYASLPDKKDGVVYLFNEYDQNYKITDEALPYTQHLLPYYFMFPSSFSTIDGNTYLVDNVHSRIISYNCHEKNVTFPVSFKLDNPMPTEYFSDMRFIEHQRSFNWLKSSVITSQGIIAEYIYDGNLSIAVIDWDGKVQTQGVYRGVFPSCYVADDVILSPITPDMYFFYWEKLSEIPKPEFDVTEDSNLLLLKWKCKLFN